MTVEKQDTMRAVVWEGKPFHMTVKDVPRPRLVEKEDVIVRITTSAICTYIPLAPNICRKDEYLSPSSTF